ncbi:MAG TPA: M24 family metallopeptidase [Bryobacteraceae bacterium]|nr:M24 family metallopeptidase [Bryobacteraceae bacterium]
MKLEEIQEALREQQLDGWLFFDHHRRDPLAYRALNFEPQSPVTRRWFYFIPATGEPRGLVHKIEAETLQALPGKHALYASWQELAEGLSAILGRARSVAMQYSPECAIPYVSMVDGGTLEMVRDLGVRVSSSANLIQYFEARWSAEQLEMHLEAGRKVDRIRGEAFQHVGEVLRADERITEWDVQQFILKRFGEEGLVTDHGPDVAVNGNASNPHYEPKREMCSEIRRGDVLLMDMWAKLGRPVSVYYDITWVGYCGPQAPSKVENVFGVVREARDRAVRFVKEGIRAGKKLHGFEVDDAARAFVREKGFDEYFFHRTGHSIGSDVHGTGANMDNLETHDTREIVPRTCFSVEPGIYLPEFGIRLELNVYVGEAEARVTGEVQDKIILL